MVSKHYIKIRNKREKLIRKYITDGNIIDEFIIDKGHKDGKEIHSITDTGLIIIHNQKSGKLITKLIARPKQIMRYYVNINKQPPQQVLILAKWHQDLNYNF